MVPAGTAGSDDGGPFRGLTADRTHVAEARCLRVGVGVPTPCGRRPEITVQTQFSQVYHTGERLESSKDIRGGFKSSCVIAARS